MPAAARSAIEQRVQAALHAGNLSLRLACRHSVQNCQDTLLATPVLCCICQPWQLTLVFLKKRLERWRRRLVDSELSLPKWVEVRPFCTGAGCIPVPCAAMDPRPTIRESSPAREEGKHKEHLANFTGAQDA